MSEDLEKYLPHVSKFDAPHEVKIEALRTCYYLMMGFVDRAFGRDPTQQALGYPVYLPLEAESPALESDGNVGQQHALKIEFQRQIGKGDRYEE